MALMVHVNILQRMSRTFQDAASSPRKPATEMSAGKELVLVCMLLSQDAGHTNGFPAFIWLLSFLGLGR